MEGRVGSNETKKMIQKEVQEETQTLVEVTEKQVVGFKIKSQKDLETANSKLVEITKREKIISQRERKMLDPTNQTRREIMDFFRPVKTRLANFKATLKTEMNRYIEVLEEQETKKKVEVEQKVVAGDMKIDTAAKKLEKLEEKKEAVTIRIERKVEITDEKKIPPAYWVLDMVAVRRDALSGKLTEGVKIVEVKNIIGKRA